MRLDRIETEETVLIDILSSPGRPELADTYIAGAAVDVSVQGLKISSDLEIPIGSALAMRLDIGVQLFRLEAVVQWSSKEDLYFCGIRLSEDSPDFIEWRALFESDVDLQVPAVAYAG
jgi:hypothetical protein